MTETTEKPQEPKPLELTLRIPRPSFGSRKPRTGGRSRRVWIVAVAVVAVLALAVDVFVYLKAQHASEVDDARTAAATAVGTRVPAMFSYSSKSLDADLAKATAQTTGAFKNDYSSVLDKVVRPAATGQQITTTAKVDASSVVSAAPDRVVLLVFLTQTTTNGSQAPTVTGSRLRVTLKDTSGGWLVSDLKTV